MTEEEYVVFIQPYEDALKNIRVRVEVLNDDYRRKYQNYPIHHVQDRIKKKESIEQKLARRGCECDVESARDCLTDISGIRVICSFTSDIYRIADMIGNQNDIKVISVKDYIKHPKASGYKSYHMLVTVPVFLSDRIVEVKVEIQIRTVAMDFWASLEHKINYKFEGNAPQHIKTELVECARMVSDLDARMLSLNEEILSLSGERDD